ncbi:MAG: glycosyltransferase family 2 protein [Pseudomonadota bacterium]
MGPVTSAATDTARRFSIVVLTWNRHDRLRQALEDLRPLAAAGAEILVVDNGSEPPVSDHTDFDQSFYAVVQIGTNNGTGSRNEGIRRASSDFIICLDDDVVGITLDSLTALAKSFDGDHAIGALCFKVVDESDHKHQINWCHDYPLEHFADRQVVTDEISEGAVCFRRGAIEGLAMFPEEYFISHEGVAVAYQVMNAGFKVVYDPAVRVIHATAPEGRKSWRRYYFDTRNNFWLVVQYFPWFRGTRRLLLEGGAMFVYSIRDGFFRYWIKGVLHGLRQTPRAWRARQAPSDNTKKLLKEIDPHRPTLLYKARARLGRKEVRI